MSYYMAQEGQYSYVKFYPHLQRHFGSLKTTMLVGKLEYWFSKEKFKQGFFKFLEPCPHRLCKPGDSWSEEMGWSRGLFRKTFDAVGVRYNSKTAYIIALHQGDPFQNKLYASYYDRQTNRTFFVRNHTFVEALFKKLRASFSSKKLYQDTSSESSQEKSKSVKISSFFDEKNQYSTDKKCQSSIYAKKNTYNSLSTPTKEDHPPKSNLVDQKTEEKKNNCLEIWEKYISPVPKIQITPRFLQELNLVFKETFQESSEKWREYCRKIASSKFLMGEKTDFKVWIQWAIKPQTIERIREGGFTFGDREVTCEEDKKNSIKKGNLLNSLREMREFYLEKHGYVGAKEASLRLRMLNLIDKNNFPEKALRVLWPRIQKIATENHGLCLLSYDKSEKYHEFYMRYFMEIDYVEPFEER